MTARASVEPDQSPKPGTSSKFPMWMGGGPNTGPISTAFPGPYVGAILVEDRT